MPSSFQLGSKVTGLRIQNLIVAIDHMIVSKSSDGREFVVLIVYDTFSRILNAYPASSKSSEFVYTCLKHFVGLRCQNPDTVCRSDAAPELVKAIRDLGWLPETSLPRRWPHNSKCVREPLDPLKSVVDVCIFKQVSRCHSQFVVDHLSLCSCCNEH